MKVKVLLNIGTESGYEPLMEGEHEVARDVGVKLIERGWAVAVAEPARPIKAVPTAPAIQSKKPTETKPANKEQ